MNNNKLYLFIFIIYLLLVFSFTHGAKAFEPVNYNSTNIGASSKLLLNSFLKENYNSNYLNYNIFGTDLNNDGILEYILKNKNCKKNKSNCSYLVVAQQEDKIVLLSKIKAQNILIDDNSSYGVRNLLVFNDKVNEYNFHIYMWSPKKKMYILRKDKLRN